MGRLMMKLHNVLRYWQQYGIVGTLGLIWEKLVVDPVRFQGNAMGIPLFYPSAAAPGEAELSCGQPPGAVCYLTHYFYPTKHGGTERFIYNIAMDQQRRGCRTVVITLGNRARKEYPEEHGGMAVLHYEYEGLEVLEIRHRHSPLGLYYKRIAQDDSALEGVARWLIKEYDIELIHAAYPQPFGPFLKAAKEAGIPYVVTVTDFCLICHYSSMITKKGRFCHGCEQGKACQRTCGTYGVRNFSGRYTAAAHILEGAKQVTAPSAFVREVFRQEFPGCEPMVVPHGLSEEFFSCGERKKTQRFLYAGTMAQLKGIRVLIEAFSRLSGDVELDIYASGDAEYEKKLRCMAKGRVTFHPAVSAKQMPEIYAQADCVVVPSLWYETYNFVLREALACGCLAIASRVGAMPEAIREGKNGFTFETGSVDSLLEKLEAARDFDWNLYERSTFPTITQEGGCYDQIYCSAKGQ